MTIARDHTGAVVGQVTDVRPSAPCPSCGLNVIPGNGEHPCAWCGGYLPPAVVLLQDGRYVTVPRSSVRLETLI